MPRGTYGALGILAGAFFLAIPAAEAQNTACTLRCITLQQIFEDQVTATIPLACDSAAIRCAGTGTLQINREAVPARIGAYFNASGIVLTIDTDQGYLKPTFGPEPSFSVGLDRAAASQSKSFPVRWQSTANTDPNMNRYLGGHFTLSVQHYAPAPPAKL